MVLVWAFIKKNEEKLRYAPCTDMLSLIFLFVLLIEDFLGGVGTITHQIKNKCSFTEEIRELS